MLTLTAAIGTYPHTEALKSGAITPEGAALDHVEVSPISDAFKRMCRGLEFDISEMSITGYLLARRYGVPITALPVFPVRAFPSSHASIAVNVDSGVEEPRDLRGKRVGARAYTGAASFWCRGVLAEEHGLEIDRVTWVSADEEHVAEYQKDAPENAVYEFGADLEKLLESGELAAGIGLRSTGSKVRPLIPNARAAAADYVRRTGVYQINHTIVVRDALLLEHPWLAGALYNAFGAAKSASLPGHPGAGLAEELGLPGGDAVPYGLAANRASLEALVRFARAQHILDRAYSIEELFPFDAESL